MRGSSERSRLGEIVKSAYPDPPEPASSGGFFVLWSTARSQFPAEAGTGDPDPGARASTRAPEARGLPEGTKARAGYRWQSEPGRVRYVGATFGACPGKVGTGFPIRACAKTSRAPRQNLFFNLVCRPSRGSTNAGGEDFGYFAPRAVKNPPSIDRTVESVRRDGCVAGCGEAQSRTCVSIVVMPISLVPQRASRLPRRSNARGMAVVKMSVTS
jgi:hypothetical protein